MSHDQITENDKLWARSIERSFPSSLHPFLETLRWIEKSSGDDWMLPIVTRALKNKKQVCINCTPEDQRTWGFETSIEFTWDMEYMAKKLQCMVGLKELLDKSVDVVFFQKNTTNQTKFSSAP
jgi:hypothetical protein